MGMLCCQISDGYSSYSSPKLAETSSPDETRPVQDHNRQYGSNRSPDDNLTTKQQSSTKCSTHACMHAWMRIYKNERYDAPGSLGMRIRETIFLERKQDEGRSSRHIRTGESSVLSARTMANATRRAFFFEELNQIGSRAARRKEPETIKLMGREGIGKGGVAQKCDSTRFHPEKYTLDGLPFSLFRRPVESSLVGVD
jgi:hypothetical protein